MSVFDDLKWRGLVNDVSDEDAVREYLETPGAAMYCGFDPTAPSLQVGNLVPLLCLVRMKKAGLSPIVLLGGATAKIGDPAGKDKERDLVDEAEIARRTAKIAAQVDALFERNTGVRAEIVNNDDWTREMTAIELLRDVGKHFTVNWMMQKESVKGRIGREGQGISFTEFSYMILQGHDFHHLFKTRGVRLQIGGADQWGNITAGTELIRRKRIDGQEAAAAYALTFPLITTADGQKFGKSAGGGTGMFSKSGGNAIWLDPEMTRPYDFYQFWINVHDQDVVRFLKYFTFSDTVTRDEIDDLESAVRDRPHLREAQRRLAVELTTIVHGDEVCRRVVAASKALFGEGDIQQVDVATLRDALAAAPAIRVDRSKIPEMPEILVALGLCKNKTQARRDIRGGGVYINGERRGPGEEIETADFIAGEIAVIRKGRKHFGVVYTK